MNHSLILVAAAIAATVLSADAGFADECPAVAEPVIAVSHGSRYEADSKTRSDTDPEGEAEIEKALGPIDDFIVDLANLSNRTLRYIADQRDDDARVAADCLLDAIAIWAAADALSEIGSMNAE